MARKMDYAKRLAADPAQFQDPEYGKDFSCFPPGRDNPSWLPPSARFLRKKRKNKKTKKKKQKTHGPEYDFFRLRLLDIYQQSGVYAIDPTQLPAWLNNEVKSLGGYIGWASKKRKRLQGN